MWEFFSDPVLRGPTIASMLMCSVAAMAGVIAYLRKQSLLGEALSHASYPGVAITIAFSGVLVGEELNGTLSILVMVGAVLSALFALFLIHFLERRLKVPSDAAICFVLASSFGIGITVASRLQFTHTTLYQQVQLFLYGQVATLSDIHILIYAFLAFVFTGMVILFFKELQLITLDRSYAKSLGVSVRKIDMLFYFLIAVSVVIGIRSVGVVLMAAMLIAPAVAARQLTNNLSTVFIFAALIGMLSGWLGNVASYSLPGCLGNWCGLEGVTLPIGPMIVLVASSFCVIALLFSPQRGLIFRSIRISRFRSKCLRENILKTIWHSDGKAEFHNIATYLQVGTFHLKWLLYRLRKQGWVSQESGTTYELSSSGRQRAAHIVRLHRLWEVYLADYLGVGQEKVHCSAEEMEHIITPEIEEELTALLNDPHMDPHQKPIPSRMQI